AAFPTEGPCLTASVLLRISTATKVESTNRRAKHPQCLKNHIEMQQEMELFDLICLHATPEKQICGTINPVTSFIHKLDSTPLRFYKKIQNEKCHSFSNNSKNTYIILYSKLKFYKLKSGNLSPQSLRHSVHSFFPSLESHTIPAINQKIYFSTIKLYT
ncbi:hypothetical protein V8G54_021522, partial [Vigna mungo]